MNDFTKEELTILFLELNIAIRNWGTAKELSGYSNLKDKIQSMIHNYRYDPWNTRKIAESHLREAESLISHAMCLLDMKGEQ